MADRYWVGGTADWDGIALLKWATTSGGVGGAAIPTSSDAVFIDANSGANQVTIATGNTGALSLDFTGFTGTFAGTAALTLSGNLTLGSGMTNTGGMTITFNATASVTFAGINTGGITINGAGITVTIQDTYQCGLITLTAGTLNFNNQSGTASALSSSNTNTRVLTMGSGTLTVGSSSTTPWTTTTTTGLTFNADTSTIKVAPQDPGNRTFAGGGLTFYKLWITGTRQVTISGSNTFNTLQIDPPSGANVTHKLTSGTTQTVTTFTVAGTSGHTITLTSSTAASAATLSKASGTVCSDWLILQDLTATGGASWYAGANSTNVSGNTGWIFSSCPMGRSFGVINGA